MGAADAKKALKSADKGIKVILGDIQNKTPPSQEARDQG